MPVPNRNSFPAGFSFGKQGHDEGLCPRNQSLATDVFVSEMPRLFDGKVLLSYGYCSEPGKYTQKDLDEVNIFDYYDKNDIIEGENIEVLNKLKGEYEKVEFVSCKIESNILSIDDILYTYMEKDDIFMSINVDKKDEFYSQANDLSNSYGIEFVRIHALYDTCELCGSSEEFIIPYNHSEKWICNNCIYDTIDYHNNYFMKSHY